MPAIDIRWQNDWMLTVTMGNKLTWDLELATTPATRMMTSMGGMMPAAAWKNNAVLSSMGPIASAFLGIGRTRLRGLTPNGPKYKAAPQMVWRVIGGRATLDGQDLGLHEPLSTQSHLGDFWLPQRGILFVGNARFSLGLPDNSAPKRVSDTHA